MSWFASGQRATNCLHHSIMAGTVLDEASVATGAASPLTAVANLVDSLAVLLSTLSSGFPLSRKQMPPLVGWRATPSSGAALNVVDSADCSAQR